MNNTIKVIGAVSLIGIGAIVGTSFTGVGEAAESEYVKVDSKSANVIRPAEKIEITQLKEDLVRLQSIRANIVSTYNLHIKDIDDKIKVVQDDITGFSSVGIE